MDYPNGCGAPFDYWNRFSLLRSHAFWDSGTRGKPGTTNTLSNIISGILLFSDGVLRLNDTIEYSGVKGRVAKIALRNTWMRRDDGTIAVISNNYLAGGPLMIHSAAERLEKKLRV